MPLIEEVEDDDYSNGNGQPGPNSTAELVHSLTDLLQRLIPPEELLAGSASSPDLISAAEQYQDHALNILRQIKTKVRSAVWSQLEAEQQGEIVSGFTRLYGDEIFTSTVIRSMIEEITAPMDCPALAICLLTSRLRKVFSSPHPSLNPHTTRALSRPSGGDNAMMDFHDTSTQTFKAPPAWGQYNSLSWAVTHLSGGEVESKIGLVLPPTLTMMDDWDPLWRGRGCTVLSKWVTKLPTEVLKRMGLDRLLLDSLLHTLALHTNPPLPQVLPLALELIDRTSDGAKRADRMAEVMDKAIMSGWIYAAPGAEGREVLINIARSLETMCGVMGVGIVRWLKTIIPGLLQPLQFSPTRPVIPHFRANLSALVRVMVTLRSTGRVSRWRGQILDICARLAVNLNSRGIEDTAESRSEKSSVDPFEELSDLLRDVFLELGTQAPSVRENEFPSLLAIAPNAFSNLIPATS